MLSQSHTGPPASAIDADYCVLWGRELPHNLGPCFPKPPWMWLADRLPDGSVLFWRHVVWHCVARLSVLCDCQLTGKWEIRLGLHAAWSSANLEVGTRNV